MDSVRLHLRINGTYLPILSIPVVECNRFALRPLKWLRFVGYTIYGREGHISLSPDDPPVDYQSAVQGGTSYFYISTLAPRLLDIRCIDDRTSDADTTESRAGFREELVARDGSCVVTNLDPFYCNAAHYCPHSKGSEYIQRLMQNRGGQNDINDINDTPNFALLDDDIPPSPGPIHGPPSTSPGRFILQHFKEQKDSAAVFFPPHNQDSRQPADMTKFPPPVIADMYYGCAAVLRWGTTESSEAIWSLVRSLYYNNISSGGENLSGLDVPNGEDDMEEGHPSQPKEKEMPRGIRAKNWADRNHATSMVHQSRMDEAMDFLMLVSCQPQPGDEGERSLTEEHSLQDSRDKVTSWLLGH